MISAIIAIDGCICQRRDAFFRGNPVFCFFSCRPSPPDWKVCSKDASADLHRLVGRHPQMPPCPTPPAGRHPQMSPCRSRRWFVRRDEGFPPCKPPLYGNCFAAVDFLDIASGTRRRAARPTDKNAERLYTKKGVPPSPASGSSKKIEILRNQSVAFRFIPGYNQLI